MKLTPEAADAIGAGFARNKHTMMTATPAPPLDGREFSPAPYISDSPRSDGEGRRIKSLAQATGWPAEGSTVTITYTNWRGVTGVRTLVIQRYWFGSTEWHPERQELFTAYEPMTGQTRDFAVSGVKDWKAAA